MSRAAAYPPFSSFDGKIFHDADFKGARFQSKVTFRNAQFNGKTDFSGAVFEGVGDFTGAQFLGDVDFSGATFTDPLRFDNIRFAGETNFSGVHFKHDAHFSESEFAGVCDFSQATFHAWGLFNKSRFKSQVTFERACFRGSAQFEDVDFATDADFRRVQFIPFANFADCRFTHPVNFSAAHFAAAANFDRVIFLRFVDFKEAHFADWFVLSPAEGSEGFAPEIRFESVTFDDPAKVRFQNISFEKTTLLGTNLRGISFENPRWPRRGLFKSTQRAVVYDEIQKEKPDPEKLARLYRDIRANLKQAGTKTDLGDLFYSEMEVRRKQRRRPADGGYFLRRYFSPYTLLWLTCGYGRRPRRAVVTAGAAALLYWLFG